MKILKPAASTTAISIKIPADLAKRFATVQAAVRERGLMLDVDAPLARALARLIRQAETDLSHGQENPPEELQEPLPAPENSDSGSTS